MLLCLVRRLPYAPNPSDRIASLNLLHIFAQRHDEFLNTPADDPHFRSAMSRSPGETRLHIRAMNALHIGTRLRRGGRSVPCGFSAS